MSLPALALRLATVNTLRGATAAGDNVLDAPMDPIARAQAVAGPVIAVFTSDQKFTAHGKSLTRGEKTKVDLRLQIFLPAEVAIAAPGGAVTIDVREEGGSTLLDVMHRQVERALAASTSGWRELWAEILTGFEGEAKVEDLIVPVERGVDLVAREIMIPCRTIPSPDIGRTQCATWPKLVTLMRADADLAPIANWIEAEISEPGVLTEDRLFMALAGLSRMEAAALGLAWPEPVEPPSSLVEATLLGDDGPRIVVTEDAP